MTSAYRKIAESSFKCYWPRPVVVEVWPHSFVTRMLISLSSMCSYQRHANRTSLPQILGKEQIEWLRQAFKVRPLSKLSSQAPILNPAHSRSNLSYAERESADLLQMLRDARIAGLFLSVAERATANSLALFTLIATIYMTSRLASLLILATMKMN